MNATIPSTAAVAVAHTMATNDPSTDKDANVHTDGAQMVPTLGAVGGDDDSERDTEKHNHSGGDDSSSDGDRERPNEEAQAGVQTAEAITMTWTKPWLVAAYATMWCIYLTNYFQSSITGNLSPFILSGFEEHSLLPVISVVTSIMAAATAVPIAKILNMWDRGHGFVCFAALATLGLILSASCNNIYTYCAAQVFSTVGFTAMIFSVDIVTMDTSSLRDRGLAYAFTSSPIMITAFAGPKASEKFYESNWRWAYGTFAIVLPIVTLPLYGILMYNKRKAIANGTLKKRQLSAEPLPRQLLNLAIELDLVGMILLAGGLALFLLPFNIAHSAAQQWESAHIIAMLVVGFVMLVSFGVYEKFVAPKPFLPYKVLASRTVLGACLLSASYQISYYSWNSYFTSLLQAVWNISISKAGYINNAFDIISGFWLIFVGLAIRKTARFKWILYGAVPIYILGEGLLIYFRTPGHGGIGLIVMCQIFMALGGSAIIICEQVAVLAAASHNDAASSLAILGVFGWIGGSIGDSVSGAIWTHTFSAALLKYLPEESLESFEDIYGSLDTQLAYEVGDATRTAISHAYADAQTYMVAAGTAFMGLALIAVFVMRNIKLDSIKQVSGVLF